MILFRVYFAVHTTISFYTVAAVTSHESDSKLNLFTKTQLPNLSSKNNSIHPKDLEEKKRTSYSSNDFLKIENSTETEKLNHKIHCDNAAKVNISCGTLEYIGCTGTKQFFHESTVKSTWFEAWEFCISQGMHLAAIESRYEQSFLEIFLENPTSAGTETYWTSGTRFSGLFTWMATGKLITYVKWRAGEPNNRNRNELCVEIIIKSTPDDLFWNDRTCTSQAYALCQKDLIR